MQQLSQQKSATRVDLRQDARASGPYGPVQSWRGHGSHIARPDVRELADAVDRYKLRHRRRFITFEELHAVISRLGYQKSPE